jgi:hypothetical protein
MMHDARLIEWPTAYVLEAGVHILLAREEYPDIEIDSPLLDRLTPDGRTHRKRLADMLHDLERLHDGWVPDERELASAPCLAAWRAIHVFGSRLPAIAGVVDAHPVLTGPVIVTSPVVAYDGRTFGWVRTMSRLYRLDHPNAAMRL